ENGQNHGPRFFQLDHTHGLHLFRARPSDSVFKRINRGIGKTERERGTKDECAAAKTAEDKERDGCDEKEWRPDLGVTNERHEQIERRVRQLLAHKMNNLFVPEL